MLAASTNIARLCLHNLRCLLSLLTPQRRCRRSSLAKGQTDGLPIISDLPDLEVQASCRPSLIAAQAQKRQQHLRHGLLV